MSPLGESQIDPPCCADQPSPVALCLADANTGTLGEPCGECRDRIIECRWPCADEVVLAR